MFEWLKKYGESNPQTKYFTLNALVYGLAIVITTVYCYGRLDFARSYRAPTVHEIAIKKEATNKQQNNPESQVTK